MGLDPAHRTPKRFRLHQSTRRFVIPSEARDPGLSCSQQEPRFLALLGMTVRGKIIEAGARLTYTSRLLSGTHKNLHAL